MPSVIHAYLVDHPLVVVVADVGGLGRQADLHNCSFKAREAELDASMFEVPPEEI
jgi:hypothetical protein